MMKCKIKTVFICTLLTASALWCQTQCNAEAQVEEPTVVAQDVQITTSVDEISAFYNVPLSYKLQSFIIQLCEEHHINPAVVIAMIDTESDFDIDAVGDGGNSFGLMQVQAKWHQKRMDKLGVTDLLNPYQNVAVGVDYLMELLDYYNGNLENALIAYNAGQLGAKTNYFSKGIYSNAYSKAVLGKIEKLTEGMITVPYSNDPLADFDMWDAEQNKQLAQLPVCADCDEPIQDEEAYYINGEWICERCMDTYKQVVLPE